MILEEVWTKICIYILIKVITLYPTSYILNRVENKKTGSEIYNNFFILMGERG